MGNNAGMSKKPEKGWGFRVIDVVKGTFAAEAGTTLISNLIEFFIFLDYLVDIRPLNN
jgi:hypothetical protein